MVKEMRNLANELSCTNEVNMLSLKYWECI